MNYKHLSEWNSGFHDWVYRRYPKDKGKQNGFMGGFISGERGSGKSTYCYKVQAKVYYTMNGYDTFDKEEDAYKEALKYMFFDPSEFRQLLIYNKIHRVITPCITLDDASMHFSNMLHMTNPRLYMALLGETATIRTAVTGFLINSPKRHHVCKFLRDYDDFKGETRVDNNGGGFDMQTWNRKVRFYRWNYYPDEVKYCIQIPFQDKYSCYIPEPFYSWYTDKKNYFEIKHELDVADTIDKNARNVFIENKDLLPKDLVHYIDKWKDEELEKARKTNIEKINEKMREENLKKKIAKYVTDKEKAEDAGI